MEQNIIGLGFDLNEFSAEQQKIVKGLLEVYDLSKQIGETQIKPGSTGGFSELKAKSEALAQLVKQHDQLTAAQKKWEQAEIQANKARQASLKTEQEVLKTMQQEEKQQQQQIKTKKEQLTYEQAIQKEKAKRLSQAAAEAKVAAQLMDEYGLLNKALKDQELRYKNLALTQGFESEAAQDALKTALDTRAVLDKLDTSLKNHQRNVGNYKSAFDGLGFSFTQVARELPSLTISAQQFFLAISNNLPMVFDEIGRAKKDIADLKAQGQEAPSLAKRIMSSILSWQVAIAVGITLITAFSKDIINAGRDMLGFGKSAEDARKEIELFNEAMKALNSILEDSAFSFRNAQSARVEGLKNELAIMQALGKSNGDILKKKQEIADVEYKNTVIGLQDDPMKTLAEANRELIEAKNNVDDLTTKFGNYLRVSKGKEDTQEFKDNVAYYKDQISAERDSYNKRYGIIRDFYNKTNALDEANNELIKYNAEQKLLRETEFAKIEAQAVIDKNERILNDERNFEQSRVNALQNASIARKRIIDADLNKTLSSPGAKNEDGTYTAEAQVAAKNAAAEKVKITKDTEIAIFNVHEDFRKRRLAAELSISQARLEYAAAEYQQIANQESRGFEDRILAYGDYYHAEQELITQEYEFQVATKIMTDKELIALQEQTNKKLLELARKSKKDLSDIIVSTGQEQLKDAAAKDGLELSKDELKLFRSLKKKEQFAKKEGELQYKAQKEQLNNALFIDNEILKSNKTTEDAKKSAQLRIYENQKRLNELELSEEKRKAEKKKEIQDLYSQLELIGVQTFFDLAQKLSDNYYAKKFANIERERKMMEDNYSKEVENIRNSTVSEQEKAAIVTQLTAREAAQKDQLARKEKEEKIKQARTDKALNIARIMVETSLAFVKALPNYPLAIATAAAAAASLALAIATPIPTYGDGTDNHPGGPMIVGEKKQGSGYQPELVTIPGQAPFITNRPMLMNAAAGTKVKPLTGDNINETMYAAMMQYTAQAIGDRTAQKLDEIKNATVEGSRMLLSAMNKQKAPITNIIVDAGWHAHISKSVIN